VPLAPPASVLLDMVEDPREGHSWTPQLPFKHTKATAWFSLGPPGSENSPQVPRGAITKRNVPGDPCLGNPRPEVRGGNPAQDICPIPGGLAAGGFSLLGL
jgi:hypothetical protein